MSDFVQVSSFKLVLDAIWRHLAAAKVPRSRNLLFGKVLTPRIRELSTALTHAWSFLLAPIGYREDFMDETGGRS
jgi:hypothetical protein